MRGLFKYRACVPWCLRLAFLRCRFLAFLLLFCVSSPASPVKPDETVVLFPSIGWQRTNGWELEIHGLVFEPHNHKLLTRLLRRALGIEGEELDSAGKA